MKRKKNTFWTDGRDCIPFNPGAITEDELSTRMRSNACLKSSVNQDIIFSSNSYG